MNNAPIECEISFVLPPYIAKELTEETWPDFERLFSQGNGWDFCWCMHFHRPCALPKSERLHSRAERGERNHLQKRQLLLEGRAHGILVYCDGEPVGWCQFGERDELPRMDGGGLGVMQTKQRVWRITCFVVQKRYRRRGIATFALYAALDAIRARGGGLVEGYPLTRPNSSTFGNVSTHGTRSMFEKAGFHIAGPPHGDNILMVRTVRRRRAGSSS